MNWNRFFEAITVGIAIASFVLTGAFIVRLLFVSCDTATIIVTSISFVVFLLSFAISYGMSWISLAIEDKEKNDNSDWEVYK